jgi:hypothetical protein
MTTILQMFGRVGEKVGALELSAFLSRSSLLIPEQFLINFSAVPK